MKNMPENDEKQKKHITGLKALNISIEFGFIIVIPLLVFGYLGKWLNNRYHAGYFIYIGIVLALITSCIWFYRMIRQLMKDMDIK